MVLHHLLSLKVITDIYKENKVTSRQISAQQNAIMEATHYTHLIWLSELMTPVVLPVPHPPKIPPHLIATFENFRFRWVCKCGFRVDHPYPKERNLVRQDSDVIDLLPKFHQTSRIRIRDWMSASLPHNNFNNAVIITCGNHNYSISIGR